MKSLGAASTRSPAWGPFRAGRHHAAPVRKSRTEKKRWLAPLVNGDIYPSFSMTEPEVSGADPTGLRTRAVQDGDEMGNQRPQVVHQRRQRRSVLDRDVRDGAGRAKRTNASA